MPKRIPEKPELCGGVWSLNVEPLNLELPQGLERSEAIEWLERLEPAFV
jgi:hypothetical protein